ncbi:signal recognition particle-docking protein FtsY, partial [Candidatus Poribacteria bacterium]|nr:signal recognition particle-docking protein FtsY [Candidatus Poribacteria bacterium]
MLRIFKRKDKEEDKQTHEIKQEEEAKKEKEAKKDSAQKLRMGLSKTRTSLKDRISGLLRRKERIDPELLDEMEEILIQSDVGVNTA